MQIIISNTFWFGLLLGTLGAACFFLWKSFFRVEEGHLAVLISHGKVQREINTNQLQIFSPGLHFKWPWQLALEISMMEKIMDLSGPDKGQNALTQDGTLLRLDSKIRMQVEVKELYSFLFALKNPLEHTKQVFTCMLSSVIAGFKTESPMGSYAEIRQQRQKLTSDMENFCQYFFDSKYGMKFLALDLTDILPPMELENALNSVQNAYSEANTLFAKAEAECEKKMMGAQKELEIARIRAKALENEMRVLIRSFEELQDDGTLTYFIQHKRTELLAGAKMTFMQSPEVL